MHRTLLRLARSSPAGCRLLLAFVCSGANGLFAADSIHPTLLFQETERFTIARLAADRLGETLYTFLGDGAVNSYSISTGWRQPLVEGKDSVGAMAGAIT